MQSTSIYSDRNKIMAELENHGGIFDCQSSRYVVYFFCYFNCGIYHCFYACLCLWFLCVMFSSRDTFVYAISADNRGLDAVTNILAEVVLRPQISVSEVNLIY